MSFGSTGLSPKVASDGASGVIVAFRKSTDLLRHPADVERLGRFRLDVVGQRGVHGHRILSSSTGSSRTARAEPSWRGPTTVRTSTATSTRCVSPARGDRVGLGQQRDRRGDLHRRPAPSHGQRRRDRRRADRLGDDRGIYTQHMTAQGEKDGNFATSGAELTDQYSDTAPAVVVASTGTAIGAWADARYCADPCPNGIYAQRQLFDGDRPSGRERERRVPAATTTIFVKWIAPGDDGTTGTATAYDLRWSTSPITPSNFGSASAVATGAPAVGGYARAADRLRQLVRHSNALLRAQDSRRGQQLVRRRRLLGSEAGVPVAADPVRGRPR